MTAISVDWAGKPITTSPDEIVAFRPGTPPVLHQAGHKRDPVPYRLLKDSHINQNAPAQILHVMAC